MDFNIKLANETEKVEKVLNYFAKELKSPLKLKAEFPELWKTMLDSYVLLDD